MSLGALAGLAALGCRCGAYGDAAPRVARNLATMAGMGQVVPWGQPVGPQTQTTAQLGYDPEYLAELALVGKGLDIFGAKLTGSRYQPAGTGLGPIVGGGGGGFPWGPVLIIGGVVVVGALVFARPRRRR